MLKFIQEYVDSVHDVLHQLQRSKENVTKFHALFNNILKDIVEKLTKAKDEFKNKAGDTISRFEEIPALQMYVSNDANKTSADYAEKKARLRELNYNQGKIFTYLEKETKILRILQTVKRNCTAIEQRLAKDISQVYEIQAQLHEGLYKLRSKLTVVISNGGASEGYNALLYRTIINANGLIDKFNIMINEYNRYVDRFNTAALSLKSSESISYYSNKRLIHFNLLNISSDVSAIIDSFRFDEVQAKIDEYFQKHNPIQKKLSFVQVSVPDINLNNNSPNNISPLSPMSSTSPVPPPKTKQKKRKTSATSMSSSDSDDSSDNDEGNTTTLKMEYVPEVSGMDVDEPILTREFTDEIANIDHPKTVKIHDNIYNFDNFMIKLKVSEWRSPTITEGLLMRYLEALSKLYNTEIHYNTRLANSVLYVHNYTYKTNESATKFLIHQVKNRLIYIGESTRYIPKDIQALFRDNSKYRVKHYSPKLTLSDLAAYSKILLDELAANKNKPLDADTILNNMKITISTGELKTLYEPTTADIMETDIYVADTQSKKTKFND